MKLATLKNGEKDGQLVVVRRDLRRYMPATGIGGTLQQALDHWDQVLPDLEAIASRLEASDVAGLPFDPGACLAPLPRAYEWVDGSAFLNHVRLVRKARNAEPPKTLETVPLVYQGGSGVLLGPRDPMQVPDFAWGADFESEVVVILGDTPIGTGATKAKNCVRLLTLANDITYRDLVPEELARGFGFFQSKPATAFAPVAVTPDEVVPYFREGRLHLSLHTWLNGELVGDPQAGDEMHFSFYDLIAHITRTRAFTAGTLLGSGTISNEDPQRGISCLAERRARETIEHGRPLTPFLKGGDRVEIDLFLPDGSSVFGRIIQEVIQ